MLLDSWIEATGGDYRHARKHVEKDSEETPEDVENWFRLYDQYIDKYGLSEKYARILKLMKKKALLDLKFAKTRDRFTQMLSEIEAEKIKNLMKDNGKGMSVEASLIPLSKSLGGGRLLKARELTVVEYQNLIEDYARSNKAA